MKTKLFLLFILLVISSFTKSQTTYIPDPNFEQALINLGYDNVLDHYVLTANIKNVTSLYMGNKNIGSLIGIEAFNALETLHCFENQLTSLNVSNNTALKHLQCGGNQLTSLNVSNCSALVFLSCNTNKLTSLDLSNCTMLQDFFCNDNQLINLDLSNNILLKRFY